MKSTGNNDKIQLVNFFSDLNETKTLFIVESLIKKGVSPLEIIECCRTGFNKIGERYHYGIYYLSDLIMASEIFKKIMVFLQPLIKWENIGDSEVDFEKIKNTKVIIGTIHGDIHDIGKDIVVFSLRSSGFDVYDLGVNVPPEKFIENIFKTGARIVGVSVLLTLCFNEIKKLIELLKESGLRENVKVIIGGSPVNEAFLEYVGADYLGGDAIESINLFKKISSKCL